MHCARRERAGSPITRGGVKTENGTADYGVEKGGGGAKWGESGRNRKGRDSTTTTAIHIIYTLFYTFFHCNKMSVERAAYYCYYYNMCCVAACVVYNIPIYLITYRRGFIVIEVRWRAANKSSGRQLNTTLLGCNVTVD